MVATSSAIHPCGAPVIRQNAVRIEMEPVVISSERETEPQAPYDFAFDTEALGDKRQSTPSHFRAYEPTEQIKLCLH